MLSQLDLTRKETEITKYLFVKGIISQYNK